MSLHSGGEQIPPIPRNKHSGALFWADAGVWQLSSGTRVWPRVAPSAGPFFKARSMTPMEAFRLALARLLFKAKLSTLGGLMLPEGGVMLIEGGTKLVFRHQGRLEIRKGTRVE
jgi:hypothetical protein